MDETPNLGLPYIMAAQSQKHVTHNEAIRALDAIVQLGVLDRDLTAPPGSPANGARYIVGASPTGAWSGHASSIAAYQDGAWMFHAPSEGWIAWVGDEDAAVVWDGSAWTALTTGGGGGSGSFTTLGVNATADTTNRLALAAAATLLNHDGAGHQLKINKASTGDTASLLYQDAFSGRAELGLAGDDDFHFKVSPDGSTWKEAILIDRSTGTVTFPFTTGGRELLTANRTYYVRADGSDSNNGLANSSGGAKLTLQGAWDAISKLDASIYAVTIQVGTGTFTGGLIINKAPLGGAGVVITGNGASSTILAPTAGFTPAIRGSVPCNLTINALKIASSTTGDGMIGEASGFNLTIGTGIDFGQVGAAHVRMVSNATVFFTAAYTISGGAGLGGHVFTQYGGVSQAYALAVTVNGAPYFSGGFVNAESGSAQAWYAMTYSYPTVTVTIASPGVVTHTAHGKSANDPVTFFNNGDTLPTGLVLGTTYYVKTVLGVDTFTLSATPGGAVINTTGSQSGTHKMGVVGARFTANMGGGINTFAGGASFFPGNASGTATSPGWYV